MKEEYEWIQSWCDRADKNDLPRILLIGDSITRGYQAYVREKLKNKFYVDYVATSYCADSEFYRALIAGMVADSDYALVHFNQGLHGYHMSVDVYKESVKSVLKKLPCKKIVIASSTLVNEAEKTCPSPVWDGHVKERNAAAQELAEELGCGFDDLWAVSCGISVDDRLGDGFHYTEKGYDVLSDAVVDSIVEYLK